MAPHLYKQYLATKDGWILRLEKYEATMRNYPSYKPPLWAECPIKLLHHYGTKIKYIKMSEAGDIEKLSMICQKHKHNIWCRMFKGYIILLTKVDLDSRKNNLVKNKNRFKLDNGWTNHRLFGSLSDKEICNRNTEKYIQHYDNCI